MTDEKGQKTFSMSHYPLNNQIPHEEKNIELLLLPECDNVLRFFKSMVIMLAVVVRDVSRNGKLLKKGRNQDIRRKRNAVDLS